MQESLLVLTGVAVGTVLTGAGCYLGAYLVKKTYSDVTNPSVPIFLQQEEDVNPNGAQESYDWDEYQSYIKPPRDEDGGEPEA